MIKLSKEKVLLLHQLIAEETGGSVGVRDVGLLESARIMHMPHLAAKSFIKPKKKKQQALDIL